MGAIDISVADFSTLESALLNDRTTLEGIQTGREPLWLDGDQKTMKIDELEGRIRQISQRIQEIRA